MELPDIVTPDLIAYIKETYLLNWNGIHGWSHWVRVCENGMRLAKQNGANERIIALFAFTHDMARHDDGRDYDHGPRAAERIRRELQGKFFNLSQEDLSLLTQAVEQHTYGFMEADITVRTCWDADRLDLGRVGIRPSAKRLSTQEARDPETLEWAYKRSTNSRRTD